MRFLFHIYVILIIIFIGADDLVSRFYKDAVIFITGGTGFLGKILVEKLLRSFEIKRIYLLVRVKNNLTVNERLAQFFEESVRICCDGKFYVFYMKTN